MTRTIVWARWVGGLGLAVGLATAAISAGCTDECQTGADCVGGQVCVSNQGVDSRDNPFEKDFVGVCTCPPGGCGEGAGGASGGFGPFGGFSNTGGYNFGGFGNLGNTGNGNAGGEGNAGGGGSGGAPSGGAGGNGGAPNGGAAGAPGGNGGTP